MFYTCEDHFNFAGLDDITKFEVKSHWIFHKFNLPVRQVNYTCFNHNQIMIFSNNKIHLNKPFIYDWYLKTGKRR